MKRTLFHCLNKIKMASLNKKNLVILRHCNFLILLLNCFYREGLINGYYFQNNYIYVYLKYYLNKPVLNNIIYFSKPSLRKYKKCLDFSKNDSWNEKKKIFITNSKGVFLLNNFQAKKLGGELMFYIN